MQFYDNMDDFLFRFLWGNFYSFSTAIRLSGRKELELCNK